MATMPHNINSATLDTSVKLLRQHVNDVSIEPLISAIEALKNDTGNETLFAAFADAFSDLGIVQGAVLTYAPYLSSLLSNDLFD